MERKIEKSKAYKHKSAGRASSKSIPIHVPETAGEQLLDSHGNYVMDPFPALPNSNSAFSFNSGGGRTRCGPGGIDRDKDRWTNNKLAGGLSTKSNKSLNGKIARSKARWRKFDRDDRMAYAYDDDMDDDRDSSGALGFFDFESDLSATLQTLKISEKPGVPTSPPRPPARGPSPGTEPFFYIDMDTGTATGTSSKITPTSPSSSLTPTSHTKSRSGTPTRGIGVEAGADVDIDFGFGDDFNIHIDISHKSPNFNGNSNDNKNDSSSDSDVEALSIPIPLRKSRSFHISQSLEEISTSLYTVLFRPTEVMGSGLTRTSASTTLALAWDATDDSEEEDSNDNDSSGDSDSNNSQASDSSSDTVVINMHGQDVFVPRIPRIEPVGSAWLREQLIAHADNYRYVLDSENPLLHGLYDNHTRGAGTSTGVANGQGAANGAGAEDKNSRFINSRFIQTMMDIIRQEDGRFSSPRLAVLQGMYRFGTGLGVNTIRERIAHCLAEVSSDHSSQVKRATKAMRELCLDPDSGAWSASQRKNSSSSSSSSHSRSYNLSQSTGSSSVSGEAGNISVSRTLQVHYTRDRGYAQVKELLEFAVICENREIMLSFYGKHTPDENTTDDQRQGYRHGHGTRPMMNTPCCILSYPQPLPANGPDAKSAEMRLCLLIKATCSTLYALPEDDFLDTTNNGGSGGKDSQEKGSGSGMHGMESENASMLIKLLDTLLLLANILNGECSYTCSSLAMSLLMRTWPKGEQCHVAIAYMKAMEVVLKYSNICAKNAANSATTASTTASASPNHHHHARRISYCLYKFLQAVRSHHHKVAELALYIIDSLVFRELLLRQEKEFYAKIDDERKGEVEKTAAGIEYDTTATATATNANTTDSNTTDTETLTDFNAATTMSTRTGINIDIPQSLPAVAAAAALVAEPLLNQLVTALRDNRDKHWHPQVQRSSAVLLEKLTDMMFQEENDEEEDE